MPPERRATDHRPLPAAIAMLAVVLCMGYLALEALYLSQDYEDQWERPWVFNLCIKLCWMAMAAHLCVLLLRGAFQPARSQAATVARATNIITINYLALYFFTDLKRTVIKYAPEDRVPPFFPALYLTSVVNTIIFDIYVIIPLSTEINTSLMRIGYVATLSLVSILARCMASQPRLMWGVRVSWTVLSVAPLPFSMHQSWQIMSAAMRTLMVQPVPQRSSSSEGEQQIAAAPDLESDVNAIRGLRTVRFMTVLYHISPHLMLLGMIDGVLPPTLGMCVLVVRDYLVVAVLMMSLVEGVVGAMSSHFARLRRQINEGDMSKMLAELERAASQKNEFLASMSYSMEEPLTHIISIATGLIRGVYGELGQSVVSTIGYIETSAASLTRLVHNILDAVKLTQGSLDTRPQPCSLRAVLQQVLPMTTGLLKPTMQMYFHCPEDTTLDVDPDRIQQVLFNLIGNACKFTRKGWVALYSGLWPEANAVWFAVKDTGVGIPKEHIHKVFEAFEQGDMTTTRQFGGTGLGLMLVKEIIAAHGGHIAVSSTPGVGTTMCVTLPAGPEGIKPPSDSTPHPVFDLVPEPEMLVTNATLEHIIETSPVRLTTSVGEKKIDKQRSSIADWPSGGEDEEIRPFWSQVHDNSYCIFSVDDDAVNRMVISCVFANGAATNHTFEVLQAESGNDALAILERMPYLPDIVLLDYMMPGLTGADTCEEMRRRHSQSLPIFIISANSEKKAECINAGADGFISKPFSRQELMLQVMSTLNQVQALRRAAQQSLLPVYYPHLPMAVSEPRPEPHCCSYALEDLAVVAVSSPLVIKASSTSFREKVVGLARATSFTVSQSHSTLIMVPDFVNPLDLHVQGVRIGALVLGLLIASNPELAPHCSIGVMPGSATLLVHDDNGDGLWAPGVCMFGSAVSRARRITANMRPGYLAVDSSFKDTFTQAMDEMEMKVQWQQQTAIHTVNERGEVEPLSVIMVPGSNVAGDQALTAAGRDWRMAHYRNGAVLAAATTAETDESRQRGMQELGSKVGQRLRQSLSQTESMSRSSLGKKRSTVQSFARPRSSTGVENGEDSVDDNLHLDALYNRLKDKNLERHYGELTREGFNTPERLANVTGDDLTAIGIAPFSDVLGVLEILKQLGQEMRSITDTITGTMASSAIAACG